MNFYIVNEQAKETPIYAFISIRNVGRFKYYPGIKVDPKKWNTRKQRTKSKDYCSIRINRILDKIERSAYDIWLQAMEEGTPLTKAHIKHRLDLVINKVKDNRRDLIEYARKLISERTMHSDFKYNTIKGYKTTLNHLIKFRSQIDFDDIDLDFFYDFLSYMNELSLAPNTQHKLIKNLKVFMNDAQMRGLHTNEKYNNKLFNVREVTSENIFMTEDDLNTLYKNRLKKVSLKKAIDLFLVMCWTGVRYGDLNKVNWENVQDGCLVFPTEKIGTYVTIPLHNTVVAILNHYNGKLPMISNQKLNDYIKDACELVRIQNARRISSHTGRRSFICNLHLAGVSDSTIMVLVGHRKHSTLMKYLNPLRKADHAAVVNKFWDVSKAKLRVI